MFRFIVSIGSTIWCKVTNFDRDDEVGHLTIFNFYAQVKEDRTRRNETNKKKQN